MGSRFKGKCHWCGKTGHKSTKYRQRLSGKPKMDSSVPDFKYKNNNKINNVSNNNNHDSHKD
jgi:hypothetical protein